MRGQRVGRWTSYTHLRTSFAHGLAGRRRGALSLETLLRRGGETDCDHLADVLAVCAARIKRRITGEHVGGNGLTGGDGDAGRADLGKGGVDDLFEGGGLGQLK
jgi:hypothetical protein